MRTIGWRLTVLWLLARAVERGVTRAVLAGLQAVR